MPQHSSCNTRLDSRLTRGLPPEKVAQVENLYNNSSEIREMLAEVLTNELNSAILLADSPKFWDSPNALAEIADQAGYRRGLRTALKLLTSRD